jgi:hypothetical protein
MHRRTALAATLLAPLAATRAAAPAAPAAPRLAAAWDTATGSHVGVLHQAAAQRWRVASAVAVPTRAHGLIQEPEGTLLAVARRPGDWLLRFTRQGQALQWHWADEARRFSGHARRRGGLLYTTETDLEAEQGVLVVRDAATLAVQAVWRTQGIDAHDLAFGPDGALWVANGGVPTAPETGRLKRNLDRMDPSIVRLDAAGGRVLGQWRLDDPRLSLRHLAWRGGRLAVALQAEHDEATRKAAAPVLALLDGERLRAATGQPPLAGYGGDIVAAPDGGLRVSVPRAGGVAHFDADGRFLRRQALPDACALCVDPRAGHVWAGGAGALARDDVRLPMQGAPRLDNHWLALRG